jgi:predicted RNA binding protein YcfA (HicA-like mRNA interferase family)
MKSSELVRLLKRDGWFVIRQSGSHMIMEHPTKKGKLFALLMVVRKSVRAWKRRSKKMQG